MQGMQLNRDPTPWSQRETQAASSRIDSTCPDEQKNGKGVFPFVADSNYANPR